MGAIPFWGDGPDGFEANPASMSGDGLYPKNPWDSVVIAGKPLPGYSRAQATGKIKSDKKKSAGSVGTTNTTLGAQACEGVSITWIIWTPAQWDVAQEFLASIIWPSVRKSKTAPYPIYYPGLAVLGIGQVQFDQIVSPIPQRGGAGTITVKCQQWLPSGKKTSVHTAAKSAEPTVSDPTKPSGAPQPGNPIAGVNYQPDNASVPLPSEDVNYSGPNG